MNISVLAFYLCTILMLEIHRKTRTHCFLQKKSFRNRVIFFLNYKAENMDQTLQIKKRKAHTQDFSG